MRLLLIEDNPGDARLLRVLLESEPVFEVEDRATLTDGLARLAQGPESPPVELLLLDLGLPDSQGLETLHQAQTSAPDLPIIVLTGLADEEIAVRAVAAGAQDYLVKGQFDAQLLIRALRYAVERKKIELALQDREQHYRTLAETAPDFIFLIGPDGCIQYVNQLAARELGASQEQIAGRHISDLFSKDSAERHWHNLKTVLTSGESLHVQNLTAFAKRELWLDTWLVPLRDSRGSVNSVMGLSRDITQQRETDIALRASEQRYRDLFENSPVGIYRTTPEGRILMANPALIRMLRYPSFYELSQRNLETQGSGPAHERRQFKQQLQQQGEIRGLETQWVRADGSILFVRENARVVRDEQGQVLYYEGTVEDVTERRIAQERLFHLNAVLRSLRKIAQLIVRETDRDRLLAQTCQTLVETRGYEYAWIALLDPQPLEAPGNAGAQDAIPAIPAVSACLPPWRLVTATHSQFREFADLLERLRSGDIPPCVRQALSQSGVGSAGDRRSAGDARRDFCDSCGSCVSSALSRGMVVRLHHTDRTYGVLVVSPAPGVTVDPEEQSLLAELSNDIAHALAALQAQTQRRWTESALRESEEKHRNLVELASDGIVIIQDMLIKYANPRLAEIAARPISELLDTQFTAYLPPEEVPKLLDLYRRRIANEQAPAFHQTTFLRPDGTLVPVEFNAVLITWQGHPADLVIVRDISERLKSQRALDQSEQRYRQLVQLSPDMILITGQGRVLYINPSGARLLGAARPEDLIGQPIGQYWHPADREKSLGLMRALQSVQYAKSADSPEPEQTPLVIERFRRLDGALVSLEGSALAFRYQDQEAMLIIAHDITARLNAEAALKQSEQNFRALADNAHDGILIADAQGRCLYANARAAEVTGYPFAELLQVTLAQLAAPEEVPKLRERLTRRLGIQESAGEPPPSQYETAIIRKDGERCEIELTAARTTWHKDTAELIIFRDITERKLMDKALRESRTELQSTLSAMQDLVFVFAPDGSFVSYHAPSESALLLPPGKFIGVHYRQVLPQHLHAPLAQALERNRQGETCEFEYSVELAGEIRWFSAKLSPMLQPQKNQSTALESLEGELSTDSESAQSAKSVDGTSLQYQGSVAVVRDITERKQAETELKASEERYRSLVDLSPDAVVVHRQGHILYANPAALTMFGLESLEAAQKKTLLDFVHPDYRELVRERVRQMTLEGKTVPLAQERFIRLDRTTIDVEVAASPVTYENQPAVLVVFRDITQRKQAEQELTRLTRLYSVLSKINEAIVRIRDPQNLCLEACRIAVEDGGFRMAWIGMFDPDSEQLRPVAVSGDDNGYLDRIREAAFKVHKQPAAADTPVVRGSARPRTPEEVVSEGHLERHIVIQDYETCPDDITWKHEAIKRGFRSSAGFPLRIGAETVGIITLYAAQPDYFDPQQQRLLQALAADLAYALEMIDIETRRRAADAELRENEERFRSIFEQALMGVAIVGADQRFSSVNPAFCRMLGYAPDQLIGRPYSQILPAVNRAQLARRLGQLFRGEKRSYRSQTQFQNRNGMPVAVALTASVVHDVEGKPSYAILMTEAQEHQ